jgi:hypothetical protein
MMDNATNNDTMIATLSGMLLDDYNIEYNATHHRLRYNGHIINLVAQAFLFRYNKEAFSAESNPGIYTTPTELEMDIWPSVASSVYAVNTTVFPPPNTYGSTNSNRKYVLYCTAVQ